MARIILTTIIALFAFQYCTKPVEQKKNDNVVFNIIEPTSTIYKIVNRDVSIEEISLKYYEKIISDNGRIVKVERYSPQGKLTDKLNIPAISVYDYNQDNLIISLRYFDQNNKPIKIQKFGYWAKEFIYEKDNRIKMVINRDVDRGIIEVPIDSIDFKVNNYNAPVLVYNYEKDSVIVKAFDSKFNLLKSFSGTAPCIPFIDCFE